MPRGNEIIGLPPEWSGVILDSITEGIFTVDKNFRITWFNRAAQEITGVPKEEALGAFCFEVLRAEVCETDCPLKETMRTGRSISGRRVHILRADGTRIPVEIGTALLRNPQGEIIGGVESFRDLSFEEALRHAAQGRESLGGMVGRSRAIRKIFSLIPQMAQSDATVLILGESGTGKELAARALHEMGPRSKGPFVALNLAALPETLVEAELFGHEAGAFTGARGKREGALARAAGGTLFLDEIGETPPAVQAKLLRFLEDRSFTPLGGKEERTVDTRVVAATNRDLEKLVKEGAFRQDLYFRLAVLVLEIPPLRERPEDIPLLAEHFLGVLSRLRGKRTAGWSPEALEVLTRYSWPGNVRELRSAVETALIFCPPGSPVLVEHLPAAIRRPGEGTPLTWERGIPATPLTLKEIEEETIKRALERNQWNREKTARELGIHRVTLYRKLKEMGLLEEKGRRSGKLPSPGEEEDRE